MAQTKLKSQASDTLLLDSIYRQAIVNGSCEVAQDAVAALSTSVVYGSVDMIYATAEGTVTSGNIQQELAAGLSTDIALILAGVTITGAGKVKIGYRMEARDARKYKNKTASFSIRVYHNVGSAKNYTIYVNKANSADNFAAITAISNSGAISVASTTETLLKYENISLGDCSNGLEIIVECDCGAITTKNFYFMQLQFNEGAMVLPFVSKIFGEILRDCKRFVEKSFGYSVSPADNTSTSGALTWRTEGGTDSFKFMPPVTYEVEKRIPDPAITYYNPSASNANKIYSASGPTNYPAVTQVTGSKGFTVGINNSAISDIRNLAVHWVSRCRL